MILMVVAVATVHAQPFIEPSTLPIAFNISAALTAFSGGSVLYLALRNRKAVS